MKSVTKINRSKHETEIIAINISLYIDQLVLITQHVRKKHSSQKGKIVFQRR